LAAGDVMSAGLIGRLLAPIQSSTLGYQIGLIGFARLSNMVRLARDARHVHPRYAPRLLLIGATGLISLPWRAWETMRWGRRIAATPIAGPPIFIVGHWRSGTTHLHNLMSQDRTLGFLTMYQAMVPTCSLAGGAWLKSLLGRIMPLKRPMDDMIWPMDAPQEEEIPLAKMTPYGFYLQAMFPRHAHDLFRRTVLLEGAGPEVEAELTRHYIRLLKIATLHAGGRRLVLKNPVNTARIRLLLALFPDAKFIHIHRNPFDVFVSTLHMYGRVFGMTTLQTIRSDNVAPGILDLYADMMTRYLAERALIPPGNLVEVRFEDLERQPLAELKRIYDELGLAGFAAAEPAFADYIAAQKSYQKNKLVLAPDDRARILERWGFAFEALGYATEEAVEREPALSRS
jgi:omega-hydroxy-beta-dihydromenaquinone-9 sulfotransferase